jgi:hypothetical protein
VDDRFFEKHEYHALAPDHNNMLRLKRLESGHVGNDHGRNRNGNEKKNGKEPMIKSLTRSIAALTTKIDKFSFNADGDDKDESSEEE